MKQSLVTITESHALAKAQLRASDDEHFSQLSVVQFGENKSVLLTSKIKPKSSCEREGPALIPLNQLLGN